MPLSEYEQRVLEQMERALTSDDPRLANTLQSSGRRSVLRYVLAGVGVVVGLLLLVIGVASPNILVGVVGFVLMFAGVVYAVVAPRRKSGPAGVVDADGNVNAPPGGARKRKPSGSGGWAGFMSRLEQRWDHRRDEGR